MFYSRYVLATPDGCKKYLQFTEQHSDFSTNEPYKIAAAGKNVPYSGFTDRGTSQRWIFCPTTWSPEWHTDYYTTSDSLPKLQSSLLMCLAWIISFPSLATKAPQRAFYTGSPVYGLLYFCVCQLLPRLGQSHVYYQIKYCSEASI